MEKADWGVWCVEAQTWWVNPDGSPFRVSKKKAEKRAAAIMKWMLAYVNTDTLFEARPPEEQNGKG